MIVDRIEAHFRGSPRGAVANLRLAQLRVMERVLTALAPNVSVETGSGISTILLGAVSRLHLVFTEDDRQAPASVIRQIEACKLGEASSIEWVTGVPATGLERHVFSQTIDFALLAGHHAHPSPVAEYEAILPHLTPGRAILALADVHLPHRRRLYEYLTRSGLFQHAALAGSLAFLRRTASPAQSLPPGWADRPLPTDGVGQTPERVLYELALVAATEGATDLERAGFAVNLGQAALGVDDRDSARAAFRSAIRLQSDNATAYDGLAWLALAERDPEEAARLRRWATLLDPNRVQLRIDLARDLIRSQNGPQAEQTLLDLLTAMPGHRDALDLLGDLYAALGRKDDERYCREKSREAGPDAPVPLYRLGDRLDFALGGDAAPYLGQGWHEPESWGRWSRGAESTVDFTLDGAVAPGAQALLSLDCVASFAWTGFQPVLTLSINHVTVAAQELAVAGESGGARRHLIRFDSGLLKSARVNTIGFRYRTPLVPKLVSETPDPRVLGFNLTALTLSILPPEAP
jgi:tetratricopeptide (TPR) repeat protein